MACCRMVRTQQALLLALEDASDPRNAADIPDAGSTVYAQGTAQVLSTFPETPISLS